MGEIKRVAFLSEKLKGGILVRKREGNSTPSPTWKFGVIQADGSLIQESNFHTNAPTSSARKLGANLWEFRPLFHQGFAKMNDHRELGEVPLEGLSELKSGISFRRPIQAPLMHHNQRVKSVGQAQQPLSPASHSSSMEVAPHRPAMSPNGSIGSGGKIAESRYHLKTSTELLKILNRIWSLEEKHALDMSLAKTLRKELDQSKTRVQELLQEKKRDQKQIDKLVKQITEGKVSKENKEQDKIMDVVKLARKELEHGRKLRRHSEKLCDKLAHELSEMKSSLINALRENERERKARRLLENLCDEFAKGVIDYEQEVRFMKHKSAQDQIGKEGSDRLVLHFSEVWLDERMQMKVAGSRDGSEKLSVLDKLRFEIETFLRANRSRNFEKKLVHSSESLHLNEPGSAPWNDRDDSTSIPFPLSQFRGGLSLKQGDFIGQQEKDIVDSPFKGTKAKPTKKNVHFRKVNEDRLSSKKPVHSSESLHLNEPGSAPWNDRDDSTSIPFPLSQFRGGISLKQGDFIGQQEKDIVDSPFKGTKAKPTKKNVHIRKVNEGPDLPNFNTQLEENADDRKIPTRIAESSNSGAGNLDIGTSKPSESQNLYYKSNYTEGSFDPSTFTGFRSPVKKWTSETTAADPTVYESSSRWPPSLKPNTLKAKLLEARIEGQQSRARTSKGSLQVD